MFMKADLIIGVNVVDIETGSTVGRAAGLMVNAADMRVVAVAVGGGKFLGRDQYVRLEDIASIQNEVLTIPSSAVLLSRKELGTDADTEKIRGSKMITQDGRELGEAAGYDIDPKSGEIQSISLGTVKETLGGLVRSSGEQFTIPRALIRTLGENIIVDNSTPDLIGMKEAA